MIIPYCQFPRFFLGLSDNSFALKCFELNGSHILENNTVLCLTVHDWTLVTLQELCGTRCVISDIRAQWVCAMDGDTRSVVLAFVVVVLACTAIFVGTHASELMGSLSAR